MYELMSAASGEIALYDDAVRACATAKHGLIEPHGMVNADPMPCAIDFYLSLNHCTVQTEPRS